MPIPRGSDPQPPRLIAYADGALNPERGSGVGVILLNEQGRVVCVATRTLPLMTNNEAEYAGLALALECAAAYAPEQIEVRMDSEIVVGQMIGEFAVNSPKLKRCHQEVCAQVRALHRVTFRHIPREQNGVADALASDAAHGRRWTTLEKPL